MDTKEKIRSNILLNNKELRLDKFISKALFDTNGYYNKKNPIGKKNDFITSPEISQIFGEIIGLYLFYIWKIKINSNFNLIELGPGKGTLFNDILNTLSKYPDFFNNAKINLIEINKKLIEIQKKNIGKSKLFKINWSEKIDFKSNKPSIIYSNEFFDCFPVRQFYFKNLWFEKYVHIDKDRLYFKDKVVNNKKLLSFLSSYEKQKVLEISFERNKYFEKICKFIKNKGGIFLTVDYGYFESTKSFTLQAIQNHRYSNVLDSIGEQDLSSHVNFNDFINIAKNNNLKIEEFCTQRDFLIKYGISERKKYLSKLDGLKKINRDVEKLIGKNAMGELFKCLIISNL